MECSENLQLCRNGEFQKKKSDLQQVFIDEHQTTDSNQVSKENQRKQDAPEKGVFFLPKIKICKATAHCSKTALY